MDLEFTINIYQPSKFLTSKKDNILQELKSQLEGKCFNEVYVTSIRSINKISMCRLETTNENATGTVNICMTVDYKTFVEGDIITDAIVYIQENRIICIGKEAIITLDTSINNKLLVNGQMIPVIVTTDMFDYYPGRSHVGMIGSILLPLLTTPTYKVTGALTSNMRATLSTLIDDIHKQTDLLQTTKAHEVTKMLSSYTNSISNDAISIDIVKLIDTNNNKDIKVTGYWTKNLRAYADKALFIHNTSVTTPKSDHINTDVLSAFGTMLHHIYSFRKAIIEISNYSEEDYEKASNIWRLMDSTKIIDDNNKS